MMEILYLNEDDVKELLEMRGALRVVEEAFREHGMKRVQMPAKSYRISRQQTMFISRRGAEEQEHI